MHEMLHNLVKLLTRSKGLNTPSLGWVSGKTMHRKQIMFKDYFPQ